MAILKEVEKRKRLREDFYQKLETDGLALPESIKNLRKILCWDQSTMAKKVGISLSALRRIEQGHINVKLDTIEKILVYFSLKLVVKGMKKN